MKYFLDFEFLEGDVPVKIFGLNIPKWLVKPNNTIQPISVGIVAEDGREYYAISKEFNLKEAWNRYDLEINKYFPNGPEYIKVYWIRENVLKSIWLDLFKIHKRYPNKTDAEYAWEKMEDKAKYIYFKLLLYKYGKSNKQIAKEIKAFVENYKYDDAWEEGDRYDSSFGNGINNTYYFVKDETQTSIITGTSESDKPVFYGYYADYDWVVFCWLFGKMIDLPKGFPMYCRDLKQMLEDKAESMTTMEITDAVFGKGIMNHNVYATLDTGALKSTKSKLLLNAEHYSTPSLKQTNKHNALADARWNKSLYEFLSSL